MDTTGDEELDELFDHRASIGQEFRDPIPEEALAVLRRALERNDSLPSRKRLTLQQALSWLKSKYDWGG